jgi:hypothetical protein
MHRNLHSWRGVDDRDDIGAAMRAIGADARAAARVLALAPSADKDRALRAMAEAVRASASAILIANSEDLAEARNAGATAAFLDRLAHRQRAQARQRVLSRSRTFAVLGILVFAAAVIVMMTKGGKSSGAAAH